MTAPSPDTRARRLWLALALLLCCAPAASAATQTFVSANGDDAATCDQDKPCRTIAGALLKTDVGGEVAVLDAGEFGPFKVTSSVKVTAGGGIYAGVTATSGDAVHVASPAGSTVALRGLTITGKGGERGINYLEPGPSREPVDAEAGVTLHVEGCTVSGFTDHGIAFHGQGSLFVKDTTVRGNGADGLSLRPAAGVRIRATVVGSRFEKNFGGLVAYSQSEVDVAVAARDTVASGNKEGGFTATGAGVRMQLQGCVASNQPYGVTAAGQGSLTLEGCLISNHKVGMWVVGGGRLYLSGTTVANNDVGLDNPTATPGSVYTFSNNRLFNNTVNAQGKPSFIAQQF